MATSLNNARIVINQGRVGLIPELYRGPIEAIKNHADQLKVDFPEFQLSSFYIRGSVSVGTAKPPYSDIDAVLIYNSRPTKVIKDYFKNLSKDIVKKTAPNLSEIDITVTSLPELLYDKNIKNLKIYLKYQSALVYGLDILDQLPEVYPGPELAIYMYEDLVHEIASLRAQFSNQGAPKTYQDEERDNKFWCVWLARTLIRSAMAMSMFTSREPSLVQDLIIGVAIAKNNYPELTPMLDKALKLSVDPTDSREELVDFIDDYTIEYIKLWDEKRSQYENQSR